MIPYYILVFLPLLPLAVFSKRETSLSAAQIGMIWFFVLLLTLMMLRAPTVGRDLDNYQIMFKLYSKLHLSNMHKVSTDKGYVLINMIVGRATKDFQWILVITSILSVVPVALVYVSEVEDLYLTIALYISMSPFLLLFSGIRQSLAIAMGMLAFVCVKRRKPILFAVFVVLAMLFHRSAFMLAIMYPLYYLKIRKIWLLGIVPFLGIVFIFNRQIFSFLSNFVSDFYSSDISSTGAYTMLFLFIAFAVVCFVIPEESELDDTTIGLRNFMLLVVALQLFAPLHALAMRMNYYYIIFVPLLLPKILNRSSVRYGQVAKVAKYVMMGYFLVNFFVFSVSKNSLDTFPYQFFWEYKR